MHKADTFCPIQKNKEENDTFSSDPEIFSRVWAEAAKMRQTGELLSCFQQISCPVTAIHGDYDPHPVQGIIEPLSRNLSRFTSIIIPNCGHCPWEEAGASDTFFLFFMEKYLAFSHHWFLLPGNMVLIRFFRISDCRMCNHLPGEGLSAT